MAVDTNRSKRLVTLRRDDVDFATSFYPEDTVVFRHGEPFRFEASAPSFDGKS
jgi:hypothetical protein